MSTGLLWLALLLPADTSDEAQGAARTRTHAQQEIVANELETIIVEAAKLPLTDAQLASRISVITDQEIEQQLAQHIGDLVRYEPGVDVTDQGSRFGLAGFSIRGISGNRVLVEVDGVPAASAFSIGSFSNASRDLVDVAALRQVEITRGPASALFGSDALGGVVSFVTRGPGDYLQGQPSYFDVSLGYNDVDASSVASATAAFGDDQWAGMLRLTARDGEQRNVPLADPMDFESLNVLAKLSYGTPGNGAVELTVEDFDHSSNTRVDSLEGVQNFTQALGFPFVIDTTDVDASDERTRSRFSVGQEWLGGLWGASYLRWRAYHQDSRTRQDTFEARSQFIAGRTSNVTRQRRFQFDQDVTGLEINSGLSFSTGGIEHQLAFGAEFERSDTAQLRDGIETDLATGLSSSQVGPDLFPLRDFPLSQTTRTGFYLQDQITLGRLTLSPGLRWDRFELDGQNDEIFAGDNPGIEPVGLDENQLSPKLGAAYQLSDRWQLYAQYAEGFRAPPVNDVNVGFTNFQFGYTTIPNPDLQAESSATVELGARFGSERAGVEVALFQTRFDNFIESLQVVDFDPVNQLLVFQSVNFDEVQIQGAEIQGSWAVPGLPEGFRLSLAAAYAEGEDRTTGLPINSVAPLNGTLGLDYAEPGGRWGASFVTRAAARQDDLNESAGELLDPAGFVVFDAFGYFRPTPGTRLRAGLYNLADHEYTAYLDVQGVPAAVNDPQRLQRPGRNFSVAFDWQF